MLNADSAALGGNQGAQDGRGSQGSQGGRGIQGSQGDRASQGTQGGRASQGSPVVCTPGDGKYTGASPCSVCNSRSQYGRQGTLQQCASCAKVAHR